MGYCNSWDLTDPRLLLGQHKSGIILAWESKPTVGFGADQRFGLVMDFDPTSRFGHAHRIYPYIFQPFCKEQFWTVVSKTLNT